MLELHPVIGKKHKLITISFLGLIQMHTQRLGKLRMFHCVAFAVCCLNILKKNDCPGLCMLKKPDELLFS